MLDDGCTVGAGAQVRGACCCPAACSASTPPPKARSSAPARRSSRAPARGGRGGRRRRRRRRGRGGPRGHPGRGRREGPGTARPSPTISRQRGARPAPSTTEGMCGEVGVELTPGACRADRLRGRHPRKGCPVGVATGGRAVRQGARRGAHRGGALDRRAGVDFGSVFEALFGFAMGYNALTLGVYLCAGEQNAIKVLCEAGLPATRRVEREIELALSRGEFAPARGRTGSATAWTERHRGHVPDRAAAAGPRRARRDACAGRLAGTPPRGGFSPTC